MNDQRFAPTTTPLDRRRRGQVLIAFSLILGAFLAFLGLLFDGGRLYFERRLAQSSADAAALGGAFELHRGNDSLVEAAALSDSLLNGFDNANGDIDVEVSSPPSTGPNAGTAGYVEVNVTKRFPTTFMRLFNRNESSVAARAVAGIEADWGPACVLALNPTTANALVASGGANLSAPDCTVMVNSNSSSAIRTNGGACITGQKIGFVQPGSYLGNGQACVSPTPKGRAIPYPDPFASLVDPDPADYVQRSNNKLQINNGNAGSHSPLQPGYYKGGIKMTGGNIVFSPGLYLVEGMEMSGGSTISGSDVTFFNSGIGIKGISIAGTVDATLSAPKSGDWQNILFFNSRSVPKNNQTEVKITGTSNSTFEGVHYFPSVHVDYAGNASGGPVWSMLIADTMRFTGTPNFQTTYGAGSGRTPTTTRVSLVE